MLSEKPLKDKILKELRVSDKINKMDKIIWKKIKENSVYSVKISNLCLRFFFAIFPVRPAAAVSHEQAVPVFGYYP